MALTRSVRAGLRRVGVDLVRYPGLGPTVMLARMLTTASVDCVVDVGANGGRYGQEVREAGWAGAIVSFEPLSEPFSRLQAASAKDSQWTAHQMGLGDRDQSARMHIASNAGESSSLLEMLDGHKQAAPDIGYVGEEEVQVRRLDAVAADLVPAADRCLLKVDTQGFERHVLDGAADFIRDRCVGVQLELSLVPMYSEGMSLEDGAAFAAAAGFETVSIFPGFTDLTSGRMLQVDAVYMRPGVL
ncbi:FkbM family methyltransferase [Williamsia sp. SKLECPSW1]